MFWFLWILLVTDAQRSTRFQRRFIRHRLPILSNPQPFSNDAQVSNDEFLSLFPDMSGSGPDVQSARLVLLQSRSYPDVQHVNDMTDEQLKALHTMDNNYVTKYIKTAHMKWHIANSIGGLGGLGTGSIFIGMHMIMMRLFEEWVNFGCNTHWRRPGWLPDQPIPAQLFIDPKFAAVGPRSTNNPKYQEPEMFTGVDPYSGLSILQCLDPDCVGRIMGLSEHVSPHFLIGGIMNTSVASVADWSAFANWHSEVQHQYETWVNSPNGVNWKEEYPNHALLRSNNINDFSNVIPFLNDGKCLIGSIVPICLYLEQRQKVVDGAQTQVFG
jgi:hypothetical protein